MTLSQLPRHRCVWCLPRYSNATALTTSATTMMSSGRKYALNSVPYHSGNAANVPAPAVMSHTSLPSQCGPMVLMRTRRSVSSLASVGMSMPTPKSKPSRTR